MKKLIALLLVALTAACTTVEPTPQDELPLAKPAESVPGLQHLANALDFLVVGDWGRNGEYRQREVATQMGKVATQLEAAFIVSTGDNFYPNGVASVSDPHWRVSFEEIYTAHSLFTDWYVVLGNHDYRGNVDAQIHYSTISRRWNLPARYYTITHQIDGREAGAEVLFVFIDTNAFQHSYYAGHPFRTPPKTPPRTAQIHWLEAVLSNTTARWKIVVGHHPLYSAGPRKDKTQAMASILQPLLENHKVDAYISGHEHHLEHAQLNSRLHHFISGAGSEVRKVTVNEKTRYAAAEPGFMAFSITPNEMRVQVINHDGSVLYVTTLEKQR